MIIDEYDEDDNEEVTRSKTDADKEFILRAFPTCYSILARLDFPPSERSEREISKLRVSKLLWRLSM